LGQNAPAGVGEDYCQVGGARPRGHVPGELLVSGGVRDDELAALGAEVAVGHVDRDPLLALALETVDEQREVGGVARRTETPAVPRDRRELGLVDDRGVVQEAADQRALPVVDAPAGEQAEQVLLLVLPQPRGRGAVVDGRRSAHQKYPWRFLFSMLASWSTSIARPWRSLDRVRSISSITS